MRILILSPFFPYPLDQGGKIRVFNLIRHLSNSHTVTLACLTAEVADFGPLADYCDEIVVVEREPRPRRDLAMFLMGGQAFNCTKFSSIPFIAQLRELLARKTFDLVQIEFSLMWQYAGIFTGIPVVLDAHNIEYRNIRQIGSATTSLLRRSVYLLEEKRLRKTEETAWRESALCFAVSNRERDEIAACTGNPTKVITVPNGVDPERFAFRRREKTGRRILFLGGMDYTPNLDAARYFLEEIYPLILKQEPEVKLMMVGRELGKIGDLGTGNRVRGSIEFHENVPDVLPWFNETDCLVVPLRLGAGTRLKIMEAFAAGLPVVSTSKGCEGIAITHNEHLLVADTPADFAAAVLHLLSDKASGLRLAERARNLVLERYTWERSVAIMEDAYPVTESPLPLSKQRTP